MLNQANFAQRTDLRDFKLKILETADNSDNIPLPKGSFSIPEEVHRIPPVTLDAFYRRVGP